MDADFREGQRCQPRKHNGSRASKMEAHFNLVNGETYDEMQYCSNLFIVD